VRVESVSNSTARLSDGRRLPADVAVWVAGAAPPPLLASLNLPRDEAGFLLTRDTLQSTGGEPIFAVGDTGSIEGRRVPKAGVFAIRQGPVLWENIAHLLSGTPLQRYEPQRHFLKLISTGDGRALFVCRNFVLHGRWCWWLKDWIDRRFVQKYQ